MITFSHFRFFSESGAQVPLRKDYFRDAISHTPCPGSGFFGSAMTGMGLLLNGRAGQPYAFRPLLSRPVFVVHRSGRLTSMERFQKQSGYATVLDVLPGIADWRPNLCFASTGSTAGSRWDSLGRPAVHRSSGCASRKRGLLASALFSVNLAR